MKYSKITLALAAFAATACAIEVLPETPAENQPEVQLYPMTFTAGADDGSDSETKVTLDGKSVLWAAGDQIKVFDGTSTPLSPFTVTSGEGTTSASFSGSVADPSANKYYALYPYQEAATFTSGNITIGKNDYTSYLTVDLPEEQQAVDGSVDPKAFLALAVSDGNGDFSFKNLNSLVKFRLSESDITKLESISISSNSLEAIAGNMKVAFNANGVPVQTYVNGKMDSYITLKAPTEGFKANTDYFIAIRSIGFASGLTITAKYEGGTCKHATSTKAPEKSLSRNSVLNLGTLPLVKGLPNNLYIAYLQGQDIDIAGTKVNKTTHHDANYISAESKDKTIKAGVNFVAPDANALFSTAELPMPLYVAGNTEGTRSPIKTDGQIKLASATDTQNNFAMENVDLTAENITTAYVIANWYDFAIEKISISNCGITLPDNKSLIYVNVGRPVNAFSMTDSDVKVSQTDASKNINMIQTSGTYTMTEVNFTNNVFWSPADVKGFNLLLNRKVTAANLIVSHNTLVNLYPVASYAFCQVYDMTAGNISNNLFYLVNYTASANDTYTGIVRELDDACSDALYQTFLRNYAIYGDSVPTKRMKVGQNSQLGQIYNKKKVDSAEIFDYEGGSANFDLVNGIFKSKNANYGAQRPQAGAQSLSARQTWSGVSEWN